MNYLSKLYTNLFGKTDFSAILMQIAIAFIIYAVFRVIAGFLSKKSHFISSKIFKISNENIENAVAKSIEKPIKLLLNVTGLFLAVMSFPFSVGVSAVIHPLTIKIFRIALIVIIGMLAVNLVDSIQYFSKKFMNSSNKTVLTFFIKIGKALVWVLIAAILLKEIGYDVTGLITSLGLGGVVLALAAQDTASNFFAGIVIIFDKPFDIGDWISVGGMEGIVEEMSFRSCRIRTFDNALISVPNSKLGSDSVTNWTRMDVRKTRITLGLLYSTKKETLQKICDEIKTNLMKYDAIKKDNIMVWFDNFNASSLDIVVQYHTYLTGAADFFNLKQEIQYMLMDVVEANGTGFAYNTQTVIMEKSE